METPTSVAQISQLAIEILSPILIALGSLIAIKISSFVGSKAREKKIDVTERHEDMMRLWIMQGIMYAEEKGRQAAKKKVAKITGPEKLEKATDFVMDMVKKYSLDKKAEAWTREQIQKRIDARMAEAKADRGAVEDDMGDSE